MISFFIYFILFFLKYFKIFYFCFFFNSHIDNYIKLNDIYNLDILNLFRLKYLYKFLKSTSLNIQNYYFLNNYNSLLTFTYKYTYYFLSRFSFLYVMIELFLYKYLFESFSNTYNPYSTILNVIHSKYNYFFYKIDALYFEDFYGILKETDYHEITKKRLFIRKTYINNSYYLKKIKI